MCEGIDLVKSFVHWPAELDANVPSATTSVNLWEYAPTGGKENSAAYLNFSSAFALRKVMSRRVFMNFPQLTL